MSIIDSYADSLSPEENRALLDVSYFQIYGLNCPRCAERVKQALSYTPGVDAVIVDFPGGLTEVTYDSALVSVEKLKAAVEAAGDGGHHRYLAEWLQ